MADIKAICDRDPEGSVEESAKRQVLTSWKDFESVFVTKDLVKDAYKQHFDNVTPDDVHLNDDFCFRYMWLSYNYLGDIHNYNVSTKPVANIEAERVLTNDTDKPYKHTVTLSVTRTKSAEVWVTQSSSITVSASVTLGSEELGIQAEFSTSFQLSNEVGSKDSTSTSVTVSDTIDVDVPAHSKITVALQVSWTSRNQKWEIPVTIDSNGRTGAQFPKRVQGHYYWSMVNSALTDRSLESKLSGQLEASYDIKGKAIVTKTESL